ncbi:MAG: hypothetical protein AAF790_10050 [Planctomycetota bacterium]
MLLPTVRHLAILVALAAAAPGVSGRCCVAAGVSLVVRQETGEVAFYNSGVAGVLLSGYDITSDAGGIAFAGWLPVAGRLDMAGDGSFDAGSNWSILTPTPNTTSIAEVGLGGGVLGANSLLLLGEAWNTAALFDLSAEAIVDGAAVPAGVLLTSLADYDLNGQVDAPDLAVFNATFGSMTDLRADGNRDGVVDGADYAFWRNSLPPAAAALSLAVVPEPLACQLAAAVWAGLVFRRRR